MTHEMLPSFFCSPGVIPGTAELYLINLYYFFGWGKENK